MHNDSGLLCETTPPLPRIIISSSIEANLESSDSSNSNSDPSQLSSNCLDSSRPSSPSKEPSSLSVPTDIHRVSTYPSLNSHHTGLSFTSPSGTSLPRRRAPDLRGPTRRASPAFDHPLWRHYEKRQEAADRRRYYTYKSNSVRRTPKRQQDKPYPQGYAAQLPAPEPQLGEDGVADPTPHGRQRQRDLLGEYNSPRPG